MRPGYQPIRTIGGAAGLVVIALLAFEVTVRLDDWARFGVSLENGAISLDDLFVRDSMGQHARPSTNYRQFRINALGFRGDEISDSVVRTRELVFTSGASETFGLYESRGHEWPRQMADSLRQYCPARQITVLNAAFAGMSLPTVVQDVRLRLLGFRPAEIVYYPTPTQYLFRSTPQASLPRNEIPRPLSVWRLRALTRVRDALKRSTPQPVLEVLRRTDTRRARAAGDTVFERLPIERLDSMEAQLRILVGAVRHGGSRMTFILPLNRFRDTSSVEERRFLRAWERQTPKATGEMLLRFGQLANDRIRRVAMDSGVHLIDATHAFGGDASTLFADFAHFTDRGAAILGGAAASEVARDIGCSPVH